VRPGFRSRLFLILALFAVLPALVVATGGILAFQRVVPLLGGTAPWDSVAASGAAMAEALRTAALTPAERAAVDAHATQLAASVSSARQVGFIAERLVGTFAVATLASLLLLGYVISRVGGHLSRQLSRPVDELVGWTAAIARGESLPATDEGRGAEEFAVLRGRMRAMSAELERGRQREVEAERLRAYRESSRRFAHELKNPLTPIRFAVERLRRDVAPAQAEAFEVLDTETRRLETMARAFAQFGRMPEGPAADVDVAELVTYTARATVPEGIALTLDLAPDLPVVRGYHDALARALSNILLNAVDACAGRAGSTITVRAEPTPLDGAAAVRVTVLDSGPGIDACVAASLWEPYETTKPGGTGLGLAIARQAIEAHGGRVESGRAPDGRTAVGFVLPVNEGLPAVTGEWHARS
jgi:nitrogen fixation/metabolism regulation signal transduction histidine kinase